MVWLFIVLAWLNQEINQANTKYEDPSQNDGFESKAQRVECEYEEPRKARQWVERIETNKDRIVLYVDPEAPDEKIANDREETLDKFIPLESMMTSADVTGWPAIVGLITKDLDFDTLLNCREVSTAFKYFFDNNRDVWLKSLDRVQHEYLDKLLWEDPEPTRRYVSVMSLEEVKNYMSWMVVLEKIKRNGTIEDIVLFGTLMKQSKKLINAYACFCPIESLFRFFDTRYANFGLEELAAISMKLFQTFLRLRLEKEDKLISIHWYQMIERICRSQNPKRFDLIKAIDDIKNFDEELRQWLEERAREVDKSNLALLAEMPFFMS